MTAVSSAPTCKASTTAPAAQARPARRGIARLTKRAAAAASTNGRVTNQVRIASGRAIQLAASSAAETTAVGPAPMANASSATRSSARPMNGHCTAVV